MRTHKLWTLFLVLLCLLAFSSTAFARADGDTGGVIETWAQIAEPPTPATPDTSDSDKPAKPETAKEKKPQFDSDGFYTRDLLYDSDTHKQFITVQGRDGNVFYIVIDYDVPVTEDEEQYKVYFLNQVDESDLAALVEDTGTATPAVCTCTQKCIVGAVNMSCPVCAVNMSECAGKEPEPEPVKEPEPEPEPVKTVNNTGSILAVLLLFVLVGGGAAYYLKVLKKKPDTKGNTDLDDYDYGEDDEENEEDRDLDEEDEDDQL